MNGGDGSRAEGPQPGAAGPAASPAPPPAAGIPGPTRVADTLRRVSRLPHVRRAALGAGILLLLSGTGYDYRVVGRPASAAKTASRAGSPSRETARLRSERRRLEARLRSKVPRGTWIVIDQTHNRLRLMQGERQVLEAPCSAGSGMVLKEGSGGRVWVFDTPRGLFRVLGKMADPVWRKPDWAFVEEGEPIPKNPADRLEYGSLGEYALYFGNGYLIHGTLYERLLGRPVSHGCIRLGREPLREVFRQSPIGTPVYIY